jgi:murein DD-endopeptidase MepM/ murein hydrolase activator NlpD
VLKQDQIFAKSGNSGYTEGPHLHYEVSKDGKNINPEQEFRDSNKGKELKDAIK